MIRLCIYLCIVLGFFSNVSAQQQKLEEFPESPTLNKVAQSGFTFLKIGVDAQSTGLAEAAVTMEGDASAVFFNPAGITAVSQRSAFVGYTNWFADIQKSAVSIVSTLGSFGHIAVSAINMEYNTVEGTEIDPTSPIGYKDTENLNIQEYAVGLTFGKRFTDRFGVGVTAKYCSQDLIAMQSNIVAFDIGTIYNIGWNGIKVGMSIQHFTTNLKYVEEKFQLPLTFHIGASADLLAVNGIRSKQHDVTLMFEGNNPIDYSERFHIGCEYWYKEIIALRCGYKLNYDEEGLSLGAGVRYSNIHVSYSHAAFGEFLGSVNRFSANVHF